MSPQGPAAQDAAVYEATAAALAGMREPDPARLALRVKSPAAVYQEIVAAARRQLLLIAPFTPPVQLIAPSPPKGTS